MTIAILFASLAVGSFSPVGTDPAPFHHGDQSYIEGDMTRTYILKNKRYDIQIISERSRANYPIADDEEHIDWVEKYFFICFCYVIIVKLVSKVNTNAVAHSDAFLVRVL